jgi:hypothetical protein
VLCPGQFPSHCFRLFLWCFVHVYFDQVRFALNTLPGRCYFTYRIDAILNSKQLAMVGLPCSSSFHASPDQILIVPYLNQLGHDRLVYFSFCICHVLFWFNRYRRFRFGVTLPGD